MDKDRVVSLRTLRGCCEVQMSSGQRLRIPRPLFRRFPLKEGEEIELEAYQALVRQQEYSPAMDRAVRLLTQRDYSVQMLRAKLLESAYADATVEKVLGFLQAKGYLDDRRFAEDLVRRRQRSRGSRGIARELQLKGIHGDLAEQLMEELSDERQLHVATGLLQKYLRGKALEEQDAWRRGMAYLARRGYEWDLAKQAMDAYRAEAAEALGEE